MDKYTFMDLFIEKLLRKLGRNSGRDSDKKEKYSYFINLFSG